MNKVEKEQRITYLNNFIKNNRISLAKNFDNATYLEMLSKEDVKLLKSIYTKPILYIDMDGVVVDYYNAAMGLNEEQRQQQYFFIMMKPIEGAIKAVWDLSDKYDVYILSTAPWSNPYAWTEKRLWIENHFSNLFFKKLILSHNKGLLKGDLIIDDRTVNGVSEFDGEQIIYGSEKYSNWDSILKYLL